MKQAGRILVMRITGKTAFCFGKTCGHGRGNRLQSCPMMGCSDPASGLSGERGAGHARQK